MVRFFLQIKLNTGFLSKSRVVENENTVWPGLRIETNNFERILLRGKFNYRYTWTANRKHTIKER